MTHDSSAAMQPINTNDPLDRICVRDFTLEVDIGAFQSERGAMQRIRFNVALEVAHSTAAEFDDVDQVLSYDTITEAIHTQLAAERLNLLETLAERIAEALLLHPRAMRVHVGIEKLDRIPGTLGIEIIRSKQNARSGEISAPNSDVLGNDALIAFMPNHVLHGAKLAAWLDALNAHEYPVIICLEPALEARPETGKALLDRRIGLLSIEQNAWVLAAKDDRCVVVDSRTELDWAIKNDQLSVWAPSKIVLDAVNKPVAGPNAPLALAQWFAQEFSKTSISVLSHYDTADTLVDVRVINAVADI